MRALLLMASLVAACGSDSGSSPPGFDADIADSGPFDAMPACQAPSSSAKIVYLATGGGDYKAGVPEDPGTNTSTILASNVTIPAWTKAATDTQAVADCLAAELADFDVKIVTTDPGTTPHMEIVVTDTATTIGLGDATGATSPLTCSDDFHAIFFVFPGAVNQRVEDVCELAAQAVGRGALLANTTGCTDIMAFHIATASCTAGFTDADVACGTDTPMACACSGMATQNSHATMLSFYGACP
jgi:hypothetical protein